MRAFEIPHDPRAVPPSRLPRWQLSYRAADAPGDAPWARLTHDAQGPEGAAAELTALPPEVRPGDVVRVEHAYEREHWFLRDDGTLARLPALRALGLRGAYVPSWRARGDDWPAAWGLAPGPGLLLALARAAGVGEAAVEAAALGLRDPLAVARLCAPPAVGGWSPQRFVDERRRVARDQAAVVRARLPLGAVLRAATAGA